MKLIMVKCDTDTYLSDISYWINIDSKLIDSLSENETEKPVISFGTISGVEIECNSFVNNLHFKEILKRRFDLIEKYPAKLDKIIINNYNLKLI